MDARMNPAVFCADVIYLNTAGMWVPVVDLSSDLNHTGRFHMHRLKACRAL
jgi:hypothetical protein